MKVALVEPLGVSPELISELGEKISSLGHDFVSFDTLATSNEELIERSRGAEVVMIANHPYPNEVIDALPELRMIAVAFTGVDHVGREAALAHSVMVCNCAGYSDVAVAEHVIGLTISLMRKINEGDAAVHDGGTNQGLAGTEIFNKTVGIVGVGHIGLQTAKLFKAFGARVLGYARHQNPEAVAAGVEYVDMDELLAKSDIVSLHLPMNPSTAKWFDAEKINKMKQGALFINCARGPIVENDALADALVSGKLAGAGIDVFDTEPPLKSNYALLNAPHTVLTPHVAFLTKEALVRRAHTEFDNVIAYINGEPTNVCEL